MSAPPRTDLIQNAVSFLADPKTQSSSLTQRIQFLEAKGLTPAEIDIAMRQANSTAAGPSYQPSFVPAGFGAYPPPRQWDWRDYFITAVASGTVMYGAISLFKKYVSPHLQPPDNTAYEEDKDALTAQFDAAEALLKEIQAETAAVRQAVDEQKEKVDKTTQEVDAAVKDMRAAEQRNRDEMREVRDEISTIRDMLPKMIEKNKESQNASLAELQQELKSLKALLMSRGPTIPSATPSPLPALGRPSIPAWQLGPAASSSPAPSTPPLPNGKGKEPEGATSSEST
ncbi:peroxisomal membrane anchor protein conserved region-domain-containing protein [Schizophyllum commune]